MSISFRLLSILPMIIIWISMQVAAGAIVIEEQPSSLLIPVNEIGVFTCSARCSSQCVGLWRINGSYTHPYNNNPAEMFVNLGFMFPPDQIHGDLHTITLMINASEAVDNTEICCEFGLGTSCEPATLLIIPDSPLTNNPSLSKNFTHVTLTWSPPFLWPGHAIQYHNVSFMNKTDGDITYRTVDSVYSDDTVTYVKKIPTEILTCTEVTFGVSAMNTSGFALEEFRVSSFMVPTRIEFPTSAINTSVLYKADGSLALVEVLVRDENENLVSILGPVSKLGSGILKEMITSNLKGNQLYSLKVQAMFYSQVITSNKHYFSTLLKNWDTNTNSVVNQVISVPADGNTGAYKAATGVSLAIAIVMLLAMVFVIVSVYFWHKYRGVEQRCQESKQRVCQTMVPNPIYDGDGEGDGPVYDSVRPQYETLVAVAPARFTETQQGSSVTDLSHNNDADVVRYVDPPIQLPQFRSQSFAHTIADIDGGSASRSYSVSLPPPRVMALKKNGQERNKLHLTLSLGESETSHDNMEAPPVPTSSRTGAAVVPVDPTEPMDESYMVMNSASVLSNLKSSVGHKPQNDA